MSAQAISDMLDDLDSTRVKLRLRSRHLWSPVATAKEEPRDVHLPSPPSLPDDEVPSRGFQ